jgi:hypothetical protein
MVRRENFLDEENSRLYGPVREFVFHIRALLSHPQLIAGGAGRAYEQTTVNA